MVTRVAQAAIKNVAQSAAIKRKEEFILVNDSVLAFGLRLTSDGGRARRRRAPPPFYCALIFHSTSLRIFAA
jgi:hypothetical protein